MRQHISGAVVAVLLTLLFLAGIGENGSATSQEQNPPTGVVEKTGSYMPMGATFKDENGQRVTLETLITEPTLFLPVYYNCPRVCSFDMANLALALQSTSRPKESFTVITLSFDEKETVADAFSAKNNFTRMLKGYFPLDSWHFLTGDKENILKATEAIGYTFKPAARGLFVHPSAMAALGGDGKIIKYIYGSFLPGDVDIALAEAEKGVPAISIKRFLAYCLEGNPTRNQNIFLILKTVFIVLLVVGGFFLIRLLTKKNAEANKSGDT